MKVAKNEYRTRLRTPVLTDILRVQMSSPDVTAFDPHKAVELWHRDSRRSRRVDYMDNNEDQQSDTDTDLCSDGELSVVGDEQSESALAVSVPQPTSSTCDNSDRFDSSLTLRLEM